MDIDIETKILELEKRLEHVVSLLAEILGDPFAIKSKLPEKQESQLEFSVAVEKDDDDNDVAEVKNAE